MSVSLDWHCYRADRSQINVQQYNQWLENINFTTFAEFDIWRGDESEYDDFRQVKTLSPADLTLRSDDDFWCIGQNAEKAELDSLDATQFIVNNIRELLPLYEACHRKSA